MKVPKLTLTGLAYFISSGVRGNNQRAGPPSAAKKGEAPVFYARFHDTALKYIAARYM
jgi:hypothetical protein